MHPMMMMALTSAVHSERQNERQKLQLPVAGTPRCRPGLEPPARGGRARAAADRPEYPAAQAFLAADQ